MRPGSAANRGCVAVHECGALRPIDVAMDRNETKRLLVIKTGALGDVLRCTSILEGLERLHGPELQVT